MHESFISFTKWELNFCAFLGRFLGVTTSQTIFSYLHARYLDNLISVPALILVPDILTYSRGFSGFPRPCSIIARAAKGADCDTLLTCFTYFSGCLPSLSTDVKGAKSAHVGSLWLGNTCARDSYIKSTDTAEVACIAGTCAGNSPFSGVASDKDACVESVCTVEHLVIHSQSFWILEIGDAGLKIRVETGWCSLYLLRILYWPTSIVVIFLGGGTKSEISIKVRLS